MDRLYEEEEEIDPKIVAHYNDLLRFEKIDFAEEHFGKNKTLLRVEVYFGNGIKAIIKVCSDEFKIFVDPVLYKNDMEISILPIRKQLDGEYRFIFLGDTYLARITSNQDTQ